MERETLTTAYDSYRRARKAAPFDADREALRRAFVLDWIVPATATGMTIRDMQDACRMGGQYTAWRRLLGAEAADVAAAKPRRVRAARKAQAVADDVLPSPGADGVTSRLEAREAYDLMQSMRPKPRREFVRKWVLPMAADSRWSERDIRGVCRRTTATMAFADLLGEDYEAYRAARVSCGRYYEKYGRAGRYGDPEYWGCVDALRVAWQENDDAGIVTAFADLAGVAPVDMVLDASGISTTEWKKWSEAYERRR